MLKMFIRHVHTLELRQFSRDSDGVSYLAPIHLVPRQLRNIALDVIEIDVLLIQHFQSSDELIPDSNSL